METKGEAFARQLEAKGAEATALLEGLTDADWKKTTAAENVDGRRDGASHRQ
jgi:hypothetical protein